MPLLKKVLLGFLVLLLGIQFIRPEKNLGSPESNNDIAKLVKVPDNVKLILNTACYDCHSNKTNYPWYSEIMPFGWILANHVKEGKEHLNFSEFAAYTPKKQDHKLEETKEEVEEKEMPLDSYTRLHKDAQLSDAQIKLITDWVDTSRKELLVK